jgi:hypothetical protein
VKSQWGYAGDEFLEAARNDLTISEHTVQQLDDRRARTHARVIGFYSLIGDPPQGRLE